MLPAAPVTACCCMAARCVGVGWRSPSQPSVLPLVAALCIPFIAHTCAILVPSSGGLVWMRLLGWLLHWNKLAESVFAWYCGCCFFVLLLTGAWTLVFWQLQRCSSTHAVGAVALISTSQCCRAGSSLKRCSQHRTSVFQCGALRLYPCGVRRQPAAC